MEPPEISKEVEQTAYSAYFISLGEFNHAFTSLEHHLTCCIKNSLSRQMREGSDEWIVNAIVGSVRIGTAKAILKRILKVIKAEKRQMDLLDKLFLQSGEIEWLRNRLAHHATFLRGTDENHWFINTDFASASEEDKSEFVGFQPGAIRLASADLIAIKQAVDDLFSMLHGLIPAREIVLPTWQYKSSKLIRHRPKSGGRQKQSARPPQS